MEAALIGLIGTVLGVGVALVTRVFEGVAGVVRDANDRSRNLRKIHEKYSDPLATAAITLMFRLEELLKDGGRGHSLRSSNVRTSFEIYKATSTLYRMAVLLGWIRGLRRELFFLRAHRRRPRQKQAALNKAIDSLVVALADGEGIEKKRVREMAAHFGIDVDEEKVAQLAPQVDFELRRLTKASGVERLAGLSEAQQRDAVISLAGIIGGMNISHPECAACGDLLPILDAREAWIYRDWQAAIGDLMLTELPLGPRVFDVIGYRQFEQMCQDGNDEQQKWLRRLNSLLDDVDVHSAANHDVRVDVLRATYRACGEIVIAVHGLEGSRSPIDSTVLGRAKDAASTSL